MLVSTESVRARRFRVLVPRYVDYCIFRWNAQAQRYAASPDSACNVEGHAPLFEKPIAPAQRRLACVPYDTDTG
jgi:hypothetical protein